MEDWTALAQDLGIVCFVSPSFPGSPVLPASGQDQACGPAGLPFGASMISPSAFPAAASLGKVRWGDDSLYDNADEKGACRGLAVSRPWNPWNEYARSAEGDGRGLGSIADNASHTAGWPEFAG